MTADIAAAAAAAATVMGAAVVAAVAAMGAAAVAAQGESSADNPVAGRDLDHRRGAWLSVCRGDLAHGLHLQPWFGRCPHGQRLARGLRHSSSLGPTGSSPPEQAHFPGLSNHVLHLSCVQTNLIGESGSQTAQYCTFYFAGGCHYLVSR